MLGALLPVLAQAAVEPPRTVNDIAIGPAEDYATAGPATVCIGDMAISPLEGETAYLAYSGIHYGSIRLVMAGGKEVAFTIGGLADVRSPDQGPSFVDGGLRSYRFEYRDDVYYLIYARDDEDGRFRPVGSIKGNGVAGNRLDRRLLTRVAFLDGNTAGCDRRYNYGWDVILGDQSLEPDVE